MRNILFQALLTLLISGLSAFSFLNKPKNFRPKVGLELYSLRREFAVDEDNALKIAHSLGFKDVEVTGVPNLKPAEFKKKLDSYGMHATSISTDMKELKESPEKVIERAKILGAEYVVIFWIDHKNDLITLEEIKEAVSVFNEGGKKLKEKGLQFCYHTHGYEFAKYENETFFDYLYKHTDAEAVKFEEDVFWVKHGGTDPVEFLKKYGKRTPLMHIKDMAKDVVGAKTGKEKVEADVVWGTGQIDIKAVILQGEKSGVKHFYLEDESPEVLKQIPLSLKFAEGI